MILADIHVTAEDFRRCPWQEVIAACAERTYHAYFAPLNAAANDAEAAGSVVCRDVFHLMAAAALLMLRDDPQHPFGPAMELQGRRTAIADDFTAEQLALFAAIAPQAEDAEFRARLADIVWVRTHDHRLARVAVDAYLASARILEDPVQWSECADRIQRGLQIASSLGDPTVVAEVIEELLHKYHGTDPSFLSCKLMELLQEMRKRRADPSIYASMADTAASRAEQERDWWRAYAYLKVLARWYKLAKDPAAESATWLRYAEDQVQEAEDALLRPASPYGASAHFMQQAIEVLRAHVPRSKKRQQELHTRLLDYQQRSMSELSAMPIEMDLTDLANGSRQAVSGRPLTAALLRLAELTRPSNMQQLADHAERQDGDPIWCLFPRVMLSGQGKVVARQPSSLGDPETASEARLATMFHDMVLCNEVIAHGVVVPAIQQIGREHSADLAAFRPLVLPFMSETHAEIVARGLHAGMLGDFLMSTHLLIPQLEHSLRATLASMGVITSGLSDDGIQKELTLAPLLELPELEQVLGADMVFNLRGLLVDPHGSNLRNDMAHGLLAFNGFFAGPSIYLWWLMLRLCCASYKQSFINTLGTIATVEATEDDSVTRTLKELESTDDEGHNPDAGELFAVASGQMGYFTTVQARGLGYSLPLLSYYVRTKRFLRVRRGLYRLRDYPSSPNEEVMAAWLSAGKERSVVSHESALALLGLSDVVPNAIHIMVPRARRGLQFDQPISLHTTTHPLQPGDVVVREGIRLTAPLRTILDAAETGTAPEQVIMAIEQARHWGWLTGDELRAGARGRGGRVVELVELGLGVA